MRKTKGIFIGAGLIALTALLLALRSGAPVQPPHEEHSSGPVSLAAQLSNTHVLANGSGEVYLDIALRGKKGRGKRRAPLNVALVIDRSGSMAGDKLANARSAARGFVERMRGGDRVAIVTYGSDVTVLVSSTEVGDSTRDAVLAAIDSITDRGGTFLSGGLEAGRQEVLRHLDGDQVGRVILISDGQANEGITSSHGLATMARETADRGVSITTMGVGLHFNEDVMTAMAESGNGYYYFIKDANALSEMFSKELKVLAATVARGPRVTIRLQPGVELETIYGYQFERVGRQFEVALPDVHSEQQRKLICKLRVPTGTVATLPVAEVTLAYLDADTDRPEQARVVARVAVTVDESAVARGEHTEVMSRVGQAQVAIHINQAMADYSSGKVSAAQDTLRQQIEVTQRLNQRLKSKALEKTLGSLEAQLRLSTEAAPSSVAGRHLVKRSKAQAYEMSK